MNKAGGFITLHRQILDWGWYKNSATKDVFLHLLLIANYADSYFQGRLIKRGQIVTSLPSISTGAGLSIQQTRTALSHLKSTGEITDESCNQYRIITVVQYDKYQTPTDESTGNQQATNRQVNSQLTDDLTGHQQHHNNNNNNNKGTNITKEQNKERETAKRFIPPTKEEILDFCLEEGLGIDVDYLYDYYSAKGWKIGSSSMKDWKAAVRNWARREKKDAPAARPAPVKQVVAQQYTQRAYDDEQQAALAAMIATARGEGAV